MFTLLATMATAEAAPTTYALSGTLYVRVFKDTTTLASDLSHDHVVVAKGWTGTATWDPEDAGSCKMDISVPVAQLEVDDSSMRAKVGLEGTLDEGMRADVKENMLDDEQLDGGTYKTITWKASGCEVKVDKVDMTGDMTIHGKSKKLTVSLEMGGDGSSFHAKGSTRLKATDYGFEPFTAMFGALANENEMPLVVSIEGKSK
jgi:polyisoprenoid-binding protein YceI